MTYFRPAKTLAEPRDDCGRCRHGQSQPYAGRALPVPSRTDAEIRAGAEQMARIRALLAGATKRMPL